MIEFNITNAPPINFDAGARQGPAGPDGNATIIPANTAIGNFTNAAALPTARTREEWLAWLQVATDAELAAALTTKQDTLVSGTSIRTVNGNNLLGSGDIVVAGGIGGSTGVNDNRLIRSDGAGGAAVQPSGITVDDSDNVVGLGSLLATGPIELRNGVSPTSLIVNNNWTNASNYERGFVRFTSNVLQIGTEQLGTGVTRPIDLICAGATRVTLNTNGVVSVPQNLAIGGNADLYRCTLLGAARNTIFFGVNTSSIAAGDVLYFATATNAVTGGVSGFQFTANCSGNLQNTLQNNNNTSSGANSRFSLVTNGASAGDPVFEWTVSGQTNWAAGIDNSDADAWVIGPNPTLGSSNAIRIGTDRVVSFAQNVLASALIGLGAYTVATLPSASANAGRIAQVTDSSVTANGSAVAGGGANRVMVFSTGTTWDVVVA